MTGVGANVVEAVAERMEIADAKLALAESVLRDVKQLARAALVDVAAKQQTPESMAATLNSIATRIAAAQQALTVTDDAEHKRGHERDDADLLAWAAGLGGAEHLEPAARLRFYAARRRATLREHGEALLKIAAADPTFARANEPEAP